jgi:hypothetical protein
MRFRDIKNQTAKVKKCQVFVLTVGEPEQSEYGYCQAIDVKDGQGVMGCLNVFLKPDKKGMVYEHETGEQYYDIKWVVDKEYYKAVPCDAPPKIKEAPTHDPAEKWDKINLGKCRHGILCAYIQNKGLPTSSTVETDADKITENITIDRAVLAVINILAHFSMTGEVE